MTCDRKIGPFVCCSVVQGDCLELMKQLPDGCVDAVITDPPFESDAHTLGRRKLGDTFGGEIVECPLPFSPITDNQRSGVCSESARICRGWLLAFCQAEAVSVWQTSMNGNGVSYRRSMVWIKPDGMPQYSGDRPGMGYESIAAGWCGEGRSEWNGGGSHGVFTFNKSNGSGPNIHPTQKPMALMLELISLFSNEGQTVLDPFAGSGTTLVAAKKLGRHFLGFEISEEYCKIARERLARIEAQPNLFEPKPEQMKLVQE